MSRQTQKQILQSEGFKSLVRKRWMVSIGLTIVMLGAYFGFLLMVAYNKALFGALITPGLSVGLLAGLGILVLAWALTGVYVNWANHTYDAEVEKIKDSM
jgi:uncharacterized membrane protein (DUF485 family)